MRISEKFDEMVRAVSGKDRIRILAFGSSNTERRICGMHWFDCLELAVKNKYGRVHHCVNSGVGGETSADLLARFDTDAAFYNPDVAVLTIGGNDSSPERDLNAAAFERNLFEIQREFDEMDCLVVFQTYYAPNKYELPEEENAAFEEYMEIVRSVAVETDSGLIDHLERWTPLRDENPEKYLELMLDPFHVNETGNLILGLRVAEEFGCPLLDPYFDKAKSYGI